jgi:hypothetical protein
VSHISSVVFILGQLSALVIVKKDDSRFECPFKHGTFSCDLKEGQQRPKAGRQTPSKFKIVNTVDFAVLQA